MSMPKDELHTEHFTAWQRTSTPLDVALMTTTVIRFAADEFGDWFFHYKNRTPKTEPTTNKKR